MEGQKLHNCYGFIGNDTIFFWVKRKLALNTCTNKRKKIHKRESNKGRTCIQPCNNDERVFPEGNFFSFRECYPNQNCKSTGIANEKSITLIIHEYTSNQQLLSIYKIVTLLSADMRNEVGFALSSSIFIKRHYFAGRKKKQLRFYFSITRWNSPLLFTEQKSFLKVNTQHAFSGVNIIGFVIFSFKFIMNWFLSLIIKLLVFISAIPNLKEL